MHCALKRLFEPNGRIVNNKFQRLAVDRQSSKTSKGKMGKRLPSTIETRMTMTRIGDILQAERG